MTEENTSNAPAPTDAGQSGADTVVAGNNDTGGADTVVSGSDTVPSGNEFSYEAWVAKQAETDPKIAKQLQRFSSVGDLAKSYIEAQKRISEGFKAPTLPDKATPEQVAEYRKAIGVPDAPDGYKLNLPEGVVLGEKDKPLWDLFLTNANTVNLTQAELDKVAPAYYAMEKSLADAQDKQIKEAYRANDAALRDIWASDTATNLSINEDFLTKTGGEELTALLANAVGSDGKPLANHPLFAKFLNDQARLSGFTKGMVYDAEGQVKNVQDEIDAILESRTGANREKYYHVSNAAQRTKDEARLVELYSARERAKK